MALKASLQFFVATVRACPLEIANSNAHAQTKVGGTREVQGNAFMKHISAQQNVIRKCLINALETRAKL